MEETYNLENFLADLQKNVKRKNLLKNITKDKFFDFLKQAISGNFNEQNLNVENMAIMNEQIEIDNLKVNNQAHIASIMANRLNSNIIKISENEIIIEPDAKLKLKSSPSFNFEEIDVFQVLNFLNDLKSKCGKNFQNCDVKNLRRNQTSLDNKKIYKYFEKKFVSIFNFTNTDINKKATNMTITLRNDKTYNKILNITINDTQNIDSTLKNSKNLKMYGTDNIDFLLNKTMNFTLKNKKKKFIIQNPKSNKYKNDTQRKYFKNDSEDEKLIFMVENKITVKNNNTKNSLLEEGFLEDDKYNYLIKNPYISDIISNYYFHNINTNNP